MRKEAKGGADRLGKRGAGTAYCEIHARRRGRRRAGHVGATRRGACAVHGRAELRPHDIAKPAQLCPSARALFSNARLTRVREFPAWRYALYVHAGVRAEEAGISAPQPSAKDGRCPFWAVILHIDVW